MQALNKKKVIGVTALTFIFIVAYFVWFDFTYKTNLQEVIEEEIIQEDIINLVFANEKDETWAFIPGDEDQRIHNTLQAMEVIELEEMVGKEPIQLKGEYAIEINLPQNQLSLMLQNGELTMKDTVYKVSNGDLEAFIENLDIWGDERKDPNS